MKKQKVYKKILKKQLKNIKKDQCLHIKTKILQAIAIKLLKA